MGNIFRDGQKLKTILNPKNWGKEDYSVSLTGSPLDFSTAYRISRTKNEKEFIWNGKRYNTQNSGTSNQQFRMYGNTNSLVSSPYGLKSKRTILNNVLEASLFEREGDFDYRANGEFRGNDLTKQLNGQRGGMIDRTIDILKEGRYPKIRSLDGIYIKAIGSLSSTEDRAKYTPLTNTMNIEGNHDMIAEASHAYRNKRKSELLSMAIEQIRKPTLSIKSYNKTYDIPHRVEYNTHRITQPLLKGYQQGYLKKDYIEPLNEIMSSPYFDQIKYNNDILIFEQTIGNIGFYDQSMIEHLQLYLSNNGYKLPKSIKSGGSYDGIYGDETHKAYLSYLARYITKNKNR
jgi:hypothetical protein